jgi:hypothetical protein
MRILIVGAGKVGAKVILQLKKNPSIKFYTVDPRDQPHALKQGVIESVDFHEDLNPSAIGHVLTQVRPDIVLVTTSAEDVARTGIPGLEILVESLRSELESTANVPIIAVARTGI